MHRTLLVPSCAFAPETGVSRKYTFGHLSVALSICYNEFQVVRAACRSLAHEKMRYYIGGSIECMSQDNQCLAFLKDSSRIIFKHSDQLLCEISVRLANLLLHFRKIPCRVGLRSLDKTNPITCGPAHGREKENASKVLASMIHLRHVPS